MRHNPGTRFGRLVVQRRIQRTKGKSYYLCLCDCGNTTVVRGTHLTDGTTKSCTCLRRELQTLPKKHGHAKDGRVSREFKSWSAMRQRCLNPKDDAFPKYGGRGIRVCNRWSSFKQFLEDMGPRPDGTTLDRIDPSGNYTPRNCRWAAPQQQTDNRQCTRKLTFNKEELALSEWFKRTGISISVLGARMRLGWSARKILTTPVRQGVSRREI